MKIPFSPPRIDEETIEMVAEVLRSGWITTGPRTKEFEKQIASYCGVNQVLCVSSATAGLELILRWYGVGEGDEVILPAYTYCATANVVRHCGATPIPVDSDPDDLNISMDAVQAAMSPRTKVIMPVDIGGFPCDHEGLKKLAESYSQFTPKGKVQETLGRPLILADSAHSFGARIGSKRVGSQADMTVFSFHAVKNLTTAEGGAIAMALPESIDEVDLYNKLNIKILHGQSKDAFSKLNTPGWKYDVVEPGYKCNMTDIQAAIGISQLKNYDQTLARRAAICRQYRAHFEGSDWAQLPVQESGKMETSYHLFMLRVNGVDEGQRDAIIDRIFEQGVSVNVHFQPLPLLTAYQHLTMDDYPVAYDNYSREISLPVYYDLTDEQVAQVTDAVEQAVQSVLE